MSFGSIEHDFTEFLGRRWSEKGLGYCLEQQRQANGETDYDLEKALTDAGLDSNKATEIYVTVSTLAEADSESAYNQGIRDGFRLALYFSADVTSPTIGGGFDGA